MAGDGAADGGAAMDVDEKKDPLTEDKKTEVLPVSELVSHSRVLPHKRFPLYCRAPCYRIMVWENEAGNGQVPLLCGPHGCVFRALMLLWLGRCVVGGVCVLV